DVEQQVGGVVEETVRLVGEPCSDQGAGHGDVPQSPAGLLEVRLDALGEVSEAGVPGAHRLDEVGQAGAGGLAPVVVQAGPHGGTQFGVAGDVRQVEQADGRGQVTGGDITALAQGADA